MFGSSDIKVTVLFSVTMNYTNMYDPVVLE